MQQHNRTGRQQSALPPRTGRFGDDKDPNMGANAQFKPGESGNPKGRPKGKRLSVDIQSMMDDEKFIDRLSIKIKKQVGIDPSEPDPEFPGHADEGHHHCCSH